jgi:5-methylcytosine-specific restriction endonuclease McrA
MIEGLLLMVEVENQEIQEIKCNGRNWVKKRKEILEYFNYTCQKCFTVFPKRNLPYKKRKLEIHHIKPKFKGGYDGMDNFLVLCLKCHRKEIKKNQKEYYFLKKFGIEQKRITDF